MGITLAKMGEKGKPLLDFFTCLSEAMMTITTWVINLAPVGVFFLIGGQVLNTDDFNAVLSKLGWYFLTVMIGKWSSEQYIARNVESGLGHIFLFIFMEFSN